MDQLRHELRATRRFRITHGPVPIQHRSAVRIRIEVRVGMRPVAFSDYKIRHPVAIHIRECRPVLLRKRNSAGILGRVISANIVLDKRDFAAGIALLFEPRKTETMSAQAGHHVVEASPFTSYTAITLPPGATRLYPLKVCGGTSTAPARFRPVAAPTIHRRSGCPFGHLR